MWYLVSWCFEFEPCQPQRITSGLIWCDSKVWMFALIVKSKWKKFHFETKKTIFCSFHVKQYKLSCIHTFPDLWPWINNCCEQWSEWVFLFNWVTLPFKLVWRGCVKELITTLLNSFKQSKSWQRHCIKVQHVKKLWIVYNWTECFLTIFFFFLVRFYFPS